jgi:hypothetical protein
MATVVDEESKQQRMETKAKAKEAADAAVREPLSPPPFLTQQDFAQYMRMSDERQCMLIECQSKMMQDVMDRNCEGRNEGVHGVSLVDFLNTRPLPFASAPEPMDAEDWLLDVTPQNRHLADYSHHATIYTVSLWKRTTKRLVHVASCT